MKAVSAWAALACGAKEVPFQVRKGGLFLVIEFTRTRD